MKLSVASLVLCAACAAPAPSTEPCQKPACVSFLVDETEAAFRDPQVLAVDDANEHWQISLGGKPLPEPESGHTIELVLGELRLVAQSWGRSGDEGDFTFPATPAEARRFAAALGVPAQEREPWRGELTGTLEAAAELVAGAEHLPLRFTLTNTGPVALWFMDGGRGRNELGRDNRFTFVIEREGERLPTRELDDFGGLGSYRRLAPGESHAFELDLAHWNRLDRAGQYRLRASYEAELLPGEFEPAKPQPPGWYSHLTRTRSVSAALTLVLR
jgi:hypothetical protein